MELLSNQIGVRLEVTTVTNVITSVTLDVTVVTFCFTLFGTVGGMESPDDPVPIHPRVVAALHATME